MKQQEKAMKYKLTRLLDVDGRVNYICTSIEEGFYKALIDFKNLEKEAKKLGIGESKILEINI